MVLRTRDRLVFGLLLPVGVHVVGMLLIAILPSRGAAAEFAGILVFIMLLWSLPVVIVLNSIFVVGHQGTRKSCFLRGMILPAIVFLAAIVYQSGLWDRLT